MKDSYRITQGTVKSAHPVGERKAGSSPARGFGNSADHTVFFTERSVKMDKETRAQLIADVTAIMEKDTEDREFLRDLLMELQERA
jgi:hypothetical protein